jgi:hypothetical protein
MSHLSATINNDDIDVVLSEISALSNNPRLKPGSADLPIDLNAKISDFISILFGEVGLKNSGDDKITWLKQQKPVNKTKIDLNRLNGFLSEHRDEIQTVIAAAAAPAVISNPTPLVSTAAAPVVSTAAPAVSPPSNSFGLFGNTPDYGRSAFNPAPAPAPAAPAPAPAPAPVTAASVEADVELVAKLREKGFSAHEAIEYTLKDHSNDLTAAIGVILNKTEPAKKEEDEYLLVEIFKKENINLIRESLKKANGNIVVAGDLIADKLGPAPALDESQSPSQPPSSPLQQTSIFNGKFFQTKDTPLGCGRFALNNLLGGRYFTAVSQNDFKYVTPYRLLDIDIIIGRLNPNIKPELKDTLDLQKLCKYLKNNDETMDPCLSSELYDQSVITNALGLLGYTVVITGGIGVSQIAKPTIDMLDYNTGMIVNLSATHYIAIRKYKDVYYLMDSQYKQSNKGSKEFISKLLNYNGNITFVVGPYDINTSKKTFIRMKIQEYYNTEGKKDEDEEDLKQDIKESLNDFITNSIDFASIEILSKKRIVKIPYLAVAQAISSSSMKDLVRLLTTP